MAMVTIAESRESTAWVKGCGEALDVHMSEGNKQVKAVAVVEEEEEENAGEIKRESPSHGSWHGARTKEEVEGSPRMFPAGVASSERRNMSGFHTRKKCERRNKK